MEVKDIIEMSKIIVPVMSGLGIAFLGSVLTLKNNIKVQKKFTLQKLRIDKIQEVAKYLMEYTKELSILVTDVNRYRFNDLKTGEFQLRFIATQEKINEFGRSIQVNKVFFQEIQRDIDAMQEIYSDIITGIHNTLILSKELSDDEKEHRLKGFIIDMTSLQMSLHTVLHDLNKILKKELEGLE
ncbi:hypothetical protein P4H20_21050 [Bacillus cereus]|nr:hypothetical protein [Bacillus cereus]